MLSYDSPVSVNGQSPASPTNITTARQVMASKSLLSSRTADMSMNGSLATPNTSVAHPAHHHVWFVTGPAGCGKSTVAMHVAEALNMPYLEGDEVRFASSLCCVNPMDSVFVLTPFPTSFTPNKTSTR